MTSEVAARGAVEDDGPGGALEPTQERRHGLAWLRGEPERNESQARVRRPADLLTGMGAFALTALVLLGSHVLPGPSGRAAHDVFEGMRHLPRVLVFVCAVVAAAATLVLLVGLGIALFRRRRLDALNSIGAGMAALVLSGGLVAALHAFRGGIAGALLQATDGSTFVRDAVIVALVTGSDTARYHHWARYCIGIVGALVVTGVALDELTFFAAVVAVLGGYGCGVLTRFALRTTVRRPSVESLLAGLRRSGIAVADLDRPNDDSTELCGRLEDGRPIVLKAAGREVHGAQLAHRLWAVTRLRGAATGRQPISLRSALETEALASLMAASAGVVVPGVLLLAHFEPDTLVLARERLEGDCLETSTRPEEAEDLFSSLRRLHDVGVAHRDLRPEQLVCDRPGGGGQGGNGRVGFRTLESAVVGAGELVRRLDLAQLLTSVGSILGAGVAVSAMRSGYGPEDEQAIAAILQPVALTGWGFSHMRAARGCLAEVRRELVGDSNVELPEPRLERFRWRTVLAVVALVVAAFLLVGQLSKVNLGGALRRADWSWFALAVLGSALTYIGSALNLLAFVPQRVSVLKGSLVELSGAFIGLVTPATVGHVAVNGRFLHKEGVDGATTATAVGLSQLVNFLVTVGLLVILALLTGTGVGHLRIVPSTRLLGVLGGLVVLGALLVTAVPWTRALFFRRVWPRVKATWPQLLDVVSQPVRLAQGIGGNLLLTGSYALALIAALHAVGAHPPIIATAAVFMAGNTVGAAAPTPGGLGAVETVLIAGLSAAGIPPHEAVPGVLLFRVATFWLPILPGWVLFLVLQRRNVL